jgi:hypothetical protein
LFHIQTIKYIFFYWLFPIKRKTYSILSFCNPNYRSCPLYKGSISPGPAYRLSIVSFPTIKVTLSTYKQRLDLNDSNPWIVFIPFKQTKAHFTRDYIPEYLISWIVSCPTIKVLQEIDTSENLSQELFLFQQLKSLSVIPANREIIYFETI